MPPPVAARRPHRHEKHGDVRLDDYYWLRDREDPEVLAYLEAENDYVDECLGHTGSRQTELFEEIKGRIKQTDVSVPFRDGAHRYYYRYEDGREYRIHCRTPVDLDEEAVILDVNALAQGHEFCDVGGLEVSPDERLLAYGVDTVGRRQYDLRVRDLVSGSELDDVIPQVTGNFVWANDSRTIFYTRQHPETLRSYQVLRHRLGTDASSDHLVYEGDGRDVRLRCRKEPVEAFHPGRLLSHVDDRVSLSRRRRARVRAARVPGSGAWTTSITSITTGDVSTFGATTTPSTFVFWRLPSTPPTRVRLLASSGGKSWPTATMS